MSGTSVSNLNASIADNAMAELLALHQAFPGSKFTGAVDLI